MKRRSSSSNLKLISTEHRIICFGRLISPTSIMASQKYEVAICLFRNDLRVEDNETLVLANESKHVLPLYVIDPRQLDKTKHFNLTRSSGHRLNFVVESLKDLRSQLKALGSDLVVRQGKTEEVIADLIKTLNLGSDVAVFLENEVLDEDVESAIEKSCAVTVVPVWGKTLYHLDDLPFATEDTPDTHKAFVKAVDSVCKVRSCLEKPGEMKPLPAGVDPGSLPTLESLGVPAPEKDSRSQLSFVGGEAVALNHLQKFLWRNNDDDTSLQVHGTKLSPWFSIGCISPRKVYWAVKTYEKEQKSNVSTEKMMSELIWRDYFQYISLKHADKMFLSDGIKGENYEWKKDMKQFHAWKDGKTGVPYVDANMRELAATGFMSNKGRENVASFLARDLKLDWRLGAEWFEANLIDHEMCNNYGNWLCSAGVGPDPEVGKWTNVVKDGQQYDPNGDYVRLWVPELQAIKSSDVHTVWKMDKEQLKSAQVEIGKTYPAPIVELAAWTE